MGRQALPGKSTAHHIASRVLGEDEGLSSIVEQTIYAFGKRIERSNADADGRGQTQLHAFGLDTLAELFRQMCRPVV